MKFALFIDLGRNSADVSMEKNVAELVTMVQRAEKAGFWGVFVGEHHGHEMTIAPNPFPLLTYLGDRTSTIRLGTGVVCAPYWHPIRLAGEAALVDHLTGGRLELGIGRGAYAYEFARMAGGIPPEVAREALAELLPALRGLWEGDYAHSGVAWNFPETTSTPRPLDPTGLPLWISARHPDNFTLAVQQRCNLMVAPLAKGFEEVESLKERTDIAVAEVNNGFVPELMVLRNAYVLKDEKDWETPVKYYQHGSGYFEALFANEGGVKQGFVQWTDPVETLKLPEYQPEAIMQNQVFGTADEVIAKLKLYEAVGTDVFMYSASWGLPHEEEFAALERFADQVMPAFRQRVGVGA